MKSIAPFLMIDKKCETAFSFYKELFNGSIVKLDNIEDDILGLNKENLKGKLAHIWLQIDDTIHIRGCNRSVFFNQHQIHLPFSVFIIDSDSKEELIELHNRLSYKGRSILSIRPTNIYGLLCMVIDQFGVYWIITYNADLSNAENT
ncbi:VOC family protein [uncultured Winogradskyella sp.]|uniref:VOC family protein n=1 Tax=uncultured Winogradskyella sp. TaxID=395353 RepID=UPI002634694B|nr:VOC family protein [uncultured Winogradskyella sp.]